MDHDFFVLDTRVGCWYLSTAMAQAVDACLAAVPVPEWVTFVDLTGARVGKTSFRQVDLTRVHGLDLSLR